MNSPFAKRIGIWCHNQDSILEVFQEINDVMPPNAILKTHRNKNKPLIILNDGSIIYFFAQNEANRGYRIQESYIFDYDLFDKDFIQEIIIPISTTVYVVTEYNGNPFSFKYKSLFQYYADLPNPALKVKPTPLPIKKH